MGVWRTLQSISGGLRTWGHLHMWLCTRCVYLTENQRDLVRNATSFSSYLLNWVKISLNLNSRIYALKAKTVGLRLRVGSGLFVAAPPPPPILYYLLDFPLWVRFLLWGYGF